jgi:hypothetical protein
MLLAIESLLQLGEPFDILGEHRVRRVLVDAAGIAAIVIGQAESGRVVDSTVFEELRGLHAPAVINP